ncbi:hypothetical protein MCEMSE15_03127 [Fimbriimonadaceae bacterium]
MESRRRKSLTLVAGTIGLALGWLTYQAVLESQIQAEFELARESGLPITASDLAGANTLATLYPNAAPYYQIVSDGLLSMDQDAQKIYSGLYDPKRNPSPEEIRQGLAQVAFLMPEIDRAATATNCRFKRDYRLGYAVLMPEYATMRQVARIKLSQAKLALAEGKRTEAVKELTLAANVARHCGSDMNEIGTAVRAWVEEDVMKVVFELKPSSDEATAVLQGLGELPDARKDIGSNLACYRYTMSTVASESDWAQVQTDLGLRKDDLQNEPVQDWLYRSGFVQKATDLSILRSMRKAAESVPANPKSTSDFAEYNRLWKGLHGAWTPMRDMFSVQEKMVDYPTSYLALVKHRDELRNF